MDESAKIVAGLALILAVGGGTTAALILRSPKWRKGSRTAATLCLLGSIIYLLAFVYCADQRAGWIADGGPDDGLSKYLDRAPVGRSQMQSFSFANALQSWHPGK